MNISMNKEKSEENSEETPSPSKPPKIGFPELPPRGSFTGSSIPYNRPPANKRGSLGAGSPSEDPDLVSSGDLTPGKGSSRGGTPVRGSSRSSTPGKESAAATPVRGSSGIVTTSKGSPGKRRSSTRSPGRESLTHTLAPRTYSVRQDGSPGPGPKPPKNSAVLQVASPGKPTSSGKTKPRSSSPDPTRSSQKLQVSFADGRKNEQHADAQQLQVGSPATPKKILKEHTGHNQATPQDASPSRRAQQLQRGHPRSARGFIQTKRPSHPPETKYELTSTGNFVMKSYEASDKETRDSVITNPPLFSGFGFSARDVAMSIHCAQVQGIINRDARRLQPPPGVRLLSHSWLMEAIMKVKQQRDMHCHGNRSLQPQEPDDEID